MLPVGGYPGIPAFSPRPLNTQGSGERAQPQLQMQAQQQQQEQQEQQKVKFEAFKKERYDEIYAHESAHKAMGGHLAGGIHIDFGSNGVAVGGHVPIKMPGLNPLNPEQSIQDAQIVQRAALAPSDPSGQDVSVAAQAQATLGRAQVMMSAKKQREAQVEQMLQSPQQPKKVVPNKALSLI